MNTFYQLLDREYKFLRRHIGFLIFDVLTIIIFIIWGTRPRILTFESKALFLGLLLLPICSFSWEIYSVYKRLSRIKEIKNKNESGFYSLEDFRRMSFDTEALNEPLIPPQYMVILLQVLMGVGFSLIAHDLNPSRHRSLEPSSLTASIPILPSSADAFKFDEVVRHKAVTDPDTPYVDITRSEDRSPKDWMENLTILPQVLYEDEQFKVEITGCKVKRHNLEINTLFTNHSPYKVTASAVNDSKYINHMKSIEMLYFGIYVEPGKEMEGTIPLYGSAIPSYDAYLDEIKCCLEIRNEDSQSASDRTLVTTEPISIVTETVDSAEPKPSLLRMDQETDHDTDLKVMYDKDGVRIIRTGIIENLLLKDGKPNTGSSTFWNILVENSTGEEILIDHNECIVNDRKADFYSEDWSRTIPAGTREEIRFNLYGAKPEDDVLSDPDTVSSVMGIASALRWPLEQIQTSSIEFDVHYTDPSGAERQVRVTDEWHKDVRENTEDEQQS